MVTDVLRQGTVNLNTGEMLRLTDAEGGRFTVARGSVWVTQDSDTQDYIVNAGGDFRVSRNGLTIIQPLGDGVGLTLGDGLVASLHSEPPLISITRRAWLVNGELYEREVRRMRAEAIGLAFRSIAAWLWMAGRRVLRAITSALQVRRTQRTLQALSVLQIKDIGLRPQDIDCGAGKLPC